MKASPIVSGVSRHGSPARGKGPASTNTAEGEFDATTDADHVIYRLEEAGATLLALPGTGWSTRLRSSSLEIVRSSLEAYGWGAARIRPAVPSSEKIDRMDEALAWISSHPRGALRSASNRWRTQSCASNLRSTLVSVAPAGGGAGDGSQSGAAMARARNRNDRPRLITAR